MASVPPPRREPTPLGYLHGLLAVTRLVRSEDTRPTWMPEMVETLAEALGYGTVVLNLHRPAWDDFIVTAVHGPPAAQDALLGRTRGWEGFRPLFDERFLVRGAYHIPHDADVDWELTPSYVPEVSVRADDPTAWHPEDVLIVPMRHSSGSLLGTLAVDEPISGKRPTATEIDVLVAAAAHAAAALESAQEAREARRHNDALERLLQVSSGLTRTLDVDAILAAVCDGIASALGFGVVTVGLEDAETGLLRVPAAADWEASRCATGSRRLADMQRVFDPRFERSGCYLLPADEARRRLPPSTTPYVSRMNGRGPLAWNDHLLVVPLHARDGRVMGVIWVDEPVDRLLPSADRLQALRVFANQATTALDSALQVEELRFLADHDVLTRLRNRRAFIRELEGETAGCLRSGRPAALVLLDLDGFKELNDRRGHAAGDEALRRVAQVLTTVLGPEDLAFRLGGDEFAILLPGSARAQAVEATTRVAATLRERLAEEFDGLTGSFGVAVFPEEAGTPDDLLRRADDEMYRAKHRLRRLHVA